MALVDVHTAGRYKAAVVAAVAALGSQGQASAALGVSKAYVSRLMRGEISLVRDVSIHAVEDRLGLGFGFLSGHATLPTPADLRARLVSRSPIAPSAPLPDVYEAVRQMDQRELRAFRAWLDAWCEDQ